MATFKRYSFSLLIAICVIIMAVIRLNEQLSAQAAPLQQTSIVFSDETFMPASWTLTEEIQGDVTSTTSQQPSGNPGNFRYSASIFPPIDPTDFEVVWSFHFYEDMVYDPAVQGPIESLSYQEDNALLNVSPSYPSASIFGYFILKQYGLIYKVGAFPIANTEWSTSYLSEVKENEIYLFVDPLPNVHPDFSESGAPITFGYARMAYRSPTDPPIPANQELIYQHGIDNWRVTVNQTSAVNTPPTAKVDYYMLDRYLFNSTVDLEVLQNDFDPDGDPLTITNVTAGNLGKTDTDGHTILYKWDQLAFAGAVGLDEFYYTISDGEFTDTEIVHIQVDCGCAVNCLEDLQNSSQFASSNSTATANGSLDIDLLYRLRDSVMKPTLHGSRYVSMYYTTTPEIARILMLDQPDLGTEAVDVVSLWQDNLYSLVDGEGSAVITQAQVDAIETFLANLSATGSSELQQLIADELTRLGSLDDYVGLTMLEARKRAIGDVGVYLPLIINP